MGRGSGQCRHRRQTRGPKAREEQRGLGCAFGRIGGWFLRVSVPVVKKGLWRRGGSRVRGPPGIALTISILEASFGDNWPIMRQKLPPPAWIHGKGFGPIKYGNQCCHQGRSPPAVATGT